MNKLLQVLFWITIVFFFSLFFSKYNNNYYENKKILTEEAIHTFEEDLKAGKEINPSNYLIKEKNYNNTASKLGRKASSWIEKGFQKILKIMMNYLNELQE